MVIPILLLGSDFKLQLTIVVFLIASSRGLCQISLLGGRALFIIRMFVFGCFFKLLLETVDFQLNGFALFLGERFLF
ncbi:hypothetical protein SDC9_84673 [bioreactor metagenome]|uniref:Uncharacterized protein n=1 Tax=bioreactor metagenome TaxID=1076179 RepID=A0A644ZAY4_9ZZZZ